MCVCEDFHALLMLYVHIQIHTCTYAYICCMWLHTWVCTSYIRCCMYKAHAFLPASWVSLATSLLSLAGPGCWATDLAKPWPALRSSHAPCANAKITGFSWFNREWSSGLSCLFGWWLLSAFYFLLFCINNPYSFFARFKFISSPSREWRDLLSFVWVGVNVRFFGRVG